MGKFKVKVTIYQLNPSSASTKHRFRIFAIKKIPLFSILWVVQDQAWALVLVISGLEFVEKCTEATCQNM